MSWAERARSIQSQTGQKAGATSNSASTALLNGNTRASSVPSSTSSHSNPSLNGHEIDEETPASSLAPSAASVDEIHDSKSGLKPAPLPPINAWSLRKQVTQPLDASSSTKSLTAEPNSAGHRGNSLASASTSTPDATSSKSSSTASTVDGTLPGSSPSAVRTNGDQVHPSNQAGPSTGTSKPAQEAWKPIPKSTVGPAVAQSVEDTNAWPSPEAASIAAEEKKKSAVQAQKVSEESDAPKTPKTEKKKAKWIPIQADITVKSSSVPKQGHIDAMQRKQERKRELNAEHRQGRAPNSSASSGDSRRKRESTAVSSRPQSQASHRSDLPGNSNALSSRRPSLASSNPPRFDQTQDHPATSVTSNKNGQRASPASSTFVYEPSSAVQDVDQTSASETTLNTGQTTVEGTYHPENMHGPLLPGSFRRGGRSSYSQGGSSSSKSGRNPNHQKNGLHSGRGGYHGDHGRPRSDHHGVRQPHSYHVDPYQTYGPVDYYGQNAAWYPPTQGYYPAFSPTQYLPVQPFIAPYVDGGTGLPFERPHPSNLHQLLDPPLEPTSYWVLGQIEFYLSEDNLARDTFLREQMDNEGWVDISMLASFKRIQSLTSDLELIFDALARSTVLEVRPGQTRRRSDWFKWVMPNAKPSSSSPGADPGDAAHLSRRASAQTDAGHLPKEQINVEAHPFPEGLSPHSQHTLIIGSTEMPPKRWRSPASKRIEVNELEEGKR